MSAYGKIASTFLQDLKFAIRSLWRAKGLAVTVVLTLALGIGANAAIFTLVRGVLLRPLVNRDEERLIYIRQSARGMGVENATFSVPEIQDLRARVKMLSALGEFSTIGFTMVGLGEPREVRAGVVDGSFFEVMGLRPVLGRLLGKEDDGPNAAGACVLTYRFWTTQVNRDPSVIGKTIRLGPRSATVVGVLEPAVPYPAETEIIANIVTSPHHLSATMVTGRVHRMTEVFGRLAPGADLDSLRAELRTVYGAMTKEHPDAYKAKDNYQIDARLLRDQITSRARNVLLVLLGASILMFVIACSNVANLILARTVRREGELGIRAALGASTGALAPNIVGRKSSAVRSRRGRWRFECRSDGGNPCAIRVPFLGTRPRSDCGFEHAVGRGGARGDRRGDTGIRTPAPFRRRAHGLGLSSSNTRVAGSANRRLRVFAITQIAASFVLLVGAATLVKTLIALQSAQTGFDTRRVLTVSVPVMSFGKTPEQVLDFYKETIRRVTSLPGVDGVAVGIFVPWRDGGKFGPGLQFTTEGRVPAPGEEDPRGRFRVISPGYFRALGVPLIAGRDFTDSDKRARRR